MIRIELDDRKYELKITGHALPAEGPEYLLVCNSVSILAQGMAYSLTKFEKDRDALVALDYRPEEGDFLLRAEPESWADAAIRKRMQIFGDALEMMAVTEGRYISMSWNGEEIIAQEDTENE